MIPRGVLDIGWRDLMLGILNCCRPANQVNLQSQVESIWSPAGHGLACLSVRSGFDLLLSTLAWPPGSEILVSAITIPDMLRIIEAHGLIAVPLDVDPRTLAIDPAAIRARSTPRTKAILIAHLFGSRMPLDAVGKEAQRLGLLLLEDCAQAFDGSYRGHPNVDVSLFSFGPIKTHTALGGALLTVRDRGLLQAIRKRHAAYPRRSNASFLRRLVTFGGLKALSHPWLLGPFAALVRWRGEDFDEVVSRSVRGFARGELLPQLRRQPSLAQLRLLRARLAKPSRAWVARRGEIAQTIAARIALPVCGAVAQDHSHWVLPIICNEPDRLQQQLIAAGFDATRKASSLVVVTAPADHPEWEPLQARHWLARLVYLPLHPSLRTQDVDRLANIVNAFAAERSPVTPAVARCEPASDAAEFTTARTR